ncbi:type II toxin-antitoxin system PemK/MazF family toxin [bacterium]|nr:type II toxin-antitoxin system PemK/MazF family toxin [bacterium]
MKPGDVILISYPFTDLSTTKVRPALVISSEGYNQREDDVVVLPITHNISRMSEEDTCIQTTDEGFQETGLKGASAIRAGKIFTLQKDLAKSQLGGLCEELLGHVRRVLKKLLEIP